MRIKWDGWSMRVWGHSRILGCWFLGPITLWYRAPERMKEEK